MSISSQLRRIYSADDQRGWRGIAAVELREEVAHDKGRANLLSLARKVEEASAACHVDDSLLSSGKEG